MINPDAHIFTDVAQAEQQPKPVENIPEAIREAMLGRTQVEGRSPIYRHVLNQINPKDFLTLIYSILESNQDSIPPEAYNQALKTIDKEYARAIKLMQFGRLTMPQLVTRVLRPLKRQHDIDIFEYINEQLKDIESVLAVYSIAMSEIMADPKLLKNNVDNGLNPDSVGANYRMIFALMIILMLLTPILVACKKTDGIENTPITEKYDTFAEQSSPVNAEDLGPYTIDELLEMPRVEYVLKSGENLTDVAYYLINHSSREIDRLDAIKILTRLNKTVPSNNSYIPSFGDPETGLIAQDGMKVVIPGLPGLNTEDLSANVMMNDKQILEDAESQKIPIGGLTGHTVQPGETLGSIALQYNFSSYQEFMNVARFLPPGSQGRAPEEFFGETQKKYEDITKPASDIIPEQLQIGTQFFWYPDYRTRIP